MTKHHDLDRELTAFLRDGPTELPDESLDAVFSRTEQSRQRVVIGPWRLPDMNKFLAAGLGAAAVVVVLLVGAQFVDLPGGVVGGEPTATPEPTATAEPTATPEPSPSEAGGLPEGPHVVADSSSGAVGITVTIPAPLWDGETNAGGLCWGDPADTCAGPPDGAGIIVFPGIDSEFYVYADPCAWSSTKPNTPATTVDELVAALASQTSREASAPEDITLDGYAGKKIILEMADDAADFGACDEGSFVLFGVADEDQARYSQGHGQIEELWIVDVDGRIVILDGLYYADTDPAIVDEVQDIIASATFEVP